MAAMEDVLKVYERPFDGKRPVVCVDEISRQLLGEVAEPLPMKSGYPKRQDSEYKKHGTFNVYLIVEPLTGWCRTKVTEHRGNMDWAQLMRELVEEDFPEAEQIVVVCDNLNTHKKASLYQKFKPDKALEIAERMDMHHTPKHGSWLNMAEITLSVLARQCLNQRMNDVNEAAAKVEAWTAKTVLDAKPIQWLFRVLNARIKLSRVYPVIDN